MGTKKDTRINQARSALHHLAEELAAVEKKTTPELRAMFAALFGHVSSSHNRTYLTRKIQYRLQELAEGCSISERVKTRLAALAETSSLRQHAKRTIRLTPEEIASVPIPKGSSPPHPRRDPRVPSIGTVLQREHDGKVHKVTIAAEGFGYQGRYFTSLSTIAKQITGSIWNGFVFFGLQGGRAAKRAT
jgi:hypothetical protein